MFIKYLIVTKAKCKVLRRHNRQEANTLIGIVLGVRYPMVICSGGQLSQEQIAQVQLSGGNFLGGNCLGALVLGGKCSGGNYLGGIVQGEIVQQAIGQGELFWSLSEEMLEVNPVPQSISNDELEQSVCLCTIADWYNRQAK